MTEPIDFTEEVSVTLQRADWQWFVTVMTDSVNKMELAVANAGLDTEDFLAVHTMRVIRDEIANQAGLQHLVSAPVQGS
jgi:hypothetical protein